MKLINFDEFKREQLLIAVAIVTMLVAAQILLMRTVSGSFSEMNALTQEAQAARESVRVRSDSVMRYKTSVKIEDKDLPGPVESENKFYAMLLNLLSAQGFADADLARTEAKDGAITFSVAGEAQYHQLLYLLASFRQGSYLMRVSALSIEGEQNNKVKYSFTVTAKVSQAVQDSAAEGQAAK